MLRYRRECVVKMIQQNPLWLQPLYDLQRYCFQKFASLERQNQKIGTLWVFLILLQSETSHHLHAFALRMHLVHQRLSALRKFRIQICKCQRISEILQKSAGKQFLEYLTFSRLRMLSFHYKNPYVPESDHVARSHLYYVAGVLHHIGKRLCRHFSAVNGRLRIAFRIQKFRNLHQMIQMPVGHTDRLIL